MIAHQWASHFLLKYEILDGTASLQIVTRDYVSEDLRNQYVLIKHLPGAK
jgi:hypothetical protein